MTTDTPEARERAGSQFVECMASHRERMHRYFDDHVQKYHQIVQMVADDDN